MDFRKLIKDKSAIFGVLLIVIAAFILMTDFLDSFVTSLLWPLLEGSSEGKTVMFLTLLGSVFIIIPILQNSDRFNAKFNKSGNYYFKYIAYLIVIMFICALFGLFIEILIRNSYGVSYFTILTSMKDTTSTTSPMHSHLYKSVLGYVASAFVPSHINTATSILRYSLPYSLVVIPVVVISYILGVVAISKIGRFSRYIASVALIVMIIGLFDGGIYSQPFLIGIFAMLIIYFMGGNFNYVKFINPVVIMGFILLLGVIIEVGGSDPVDHTLTVINQTQDVDMSGLNVTCVIHDGDKTIYTINSTKSDKEIIQEVFKLYEGKCDLTFMTWDFYSYLENPTMKQRQIQKYGYEL
ncbi:MAG: hypothetical protein SOZ23_01565 [Methanosphaera sp.]|uniref:hypothetical protein n=1 Tax=Methanosphaera sp. TaxID=2666342 RepID=UPI0025DCFD32|nr:hypothetical protein [Methanosphaera sp.]MCI5866557.1 hypothetical protein [Methanosphaera sp.]MDD6535033.1 hypothetical protein [Methanosphaera sp.]MDY3955466.1 hypothetical protein [Methanosphaera sp.]